MFSSCVFFLCLIVVSWLVYFSLGVLGILRGICEIKDQSWDICDQGEETL